MIDPKDKNGEVTVKQIWQPSTWMFYAVAVAACVFGVWAISASLASRRAGEALVAAKAEGEKRLSESKIQSEQAVRDTQRTGLRRTAQAVARALAPFVALKGQVTEITDRTLQSSVREMVKDRDLRFLAVSDPSGNVVAASDLTLIGRPAVGPDGMTVESAPIGDDPSKGTVYLGVAP